MLSFPGCAVSSCLIQWPTECVWHCFIAVSSIMSHPMTNSLWVTLLYCSLINHVSSHDQQVVSDTALLQSHQSCLIPWPTGSEWHCFIAVSSIMSHPMTNSMWVTLLYCSLINHVSSHDQQVVSDTALLQSHQSCHLVPQQIEGVLGLHFYCPSRISFHEQEGEFCYYTG